MNNYDGVQVVAFHKSGSMFLYRYFKKLSTIINYNYYSINNNPKNDEDFSQNQNRNKLLCPIRSIPSYNNKIFHIIHIRDPRDLLISAYYSFGWTHPVPKERLLIEGFLKRKNYIQSLTLDEYCVNEESLATMKSKFTTLIKLLEKANKNNIYISDYSEMVLNFENWNYKMSKLFKLNENQIKTMKNSFMEEFINIKVTTTDDIINNNIKVHQREATPGQFKKYLKPETVKILNNEFAELFESLSKYGFKF